MWAPSLQRSLSGVPSRPDRVEAESADEAGGDLEARCEDQQVELVFHAVDHRSGRADLANAHAVGVDEVDVGFVERGEVVVVEADPLAVLAVPGHQLLGGVGVLHGVGDPLAQFGHHLEVRFVELAALLGALGLDVGVLPEDLRPAVAHEVTLRLLAGHRRR